MPVRNLIRRARDKVAGFARIPIVGFCLGWLRTVTRTGWAVFVCALIAMWLASTWGWVEAFVIAIICGVILIFALILVIWPTPHRIEIRLPQERIVAGQTAIGGITVTNMRNRPAGTGVIELPIGQGAGQFIVPPLAPQAQWEEVFSVVTRRRGLIAVGPARSVRADGLGLLRRVRVWDKPDILRVHPRTVRIPFDATGFQVDVEGVTTAKLSSSDVSFHALRDYEPGDDRRNVHWTSTARLGRLIVRQFEETRRSHHLIVVDTGVQKWPREAFETAISVGASLALAGLGSSRTVSMSTSSAWVSTSSPIRMLDDLTEVESQDNADVEARVRHCLQERGGVSALTVIVSPETTDETAARITTSSSADISTIVIRVRPGASRRRRRLTSGVLLDCPSLDDLPRLIAGGALS
ncbi:DUF58 domain-containing protein [Schaalia vaccimaxillae]|uniref:DUF58 domain-containing protein n=1 Tax=Schaalia vaccimaxillae TaxID=183916 RepID=UPI0003B7919F|nr:DUF58 domain-containing protein [Schaalia vaccimaxillae]